jgi:hypothetical protein
MQLVTSSRFSGKDADPLRSFCSFATGNSSLTSIQIKLLAGFFLEFFGIPCPPLLEDIVKVAKTCGVSLEESVMPLRGYWHKSNGKLQVFTRQQDSEFRRMFTLLHEIREIIQSICRETDRELSVNCPEWQAETFASAVITGAGLVELSQFEKLLVRLKGKSWWATLLLWMWANIFRAPLFSEWCDYIWEVLHQREVQVSNELVKSSFPNLLFFLYAQALMNLSETARHKYFLSGSWPAEIGFCDRVRLRLFIRGRDLETGKRMQQTLTVRGTNLKTPEERRQ